MKKLLSLILSLVLMLTVTGVMTSYADASLVVGKTVSVSVPANETVTLSLTPDATGIYVIESHADGCDPYAELFLGETVLAAHDDIVFNEDTPESNDFNFFLSVILQAGETYTVEITEQNASAAKFDVSTAFYAAVTDVAFTAAAPYQYIDNSDIYDFTFNGGDTLTVNSDKGDYRFVYDAEQDAFLDSDGDAMSNTFSTDVSISAVFDEDSVEEASGFLNRAAVSFFHYYFEFDTVTVPNPVKSISYQPIKPLIAVKNVTGDWDTDANGNRYFDYYPDFLSNNDVLTVNYTDGKTVKYVYREKRVYMDDESEEWEMDFVSNQGETLLFPYFDFYDTQYEKHWQVGTNYLTVSYMGIEYQVPVKVINPGWYKDGGKWYYYEKQEGRLLTGWQKLDGKWYYFNSAGVMLTGWQKLGGKWYYLNSSGAMVTGWQKVSGTWYYFNSSGAMVTGWQKVSGIWYYFNGSGAMVTGWQKIGGTWYYFNSGGDMRTANLTQGGKTYRFNSSGACINP